MLTVRDLMTAGATVAPAGMSLHAVARLLVENEISGVPVVDAAGEILGVVSEADIVEKERGPDEASGRVRRLLGHRDRGAAVATTAREAMTSPAIVVESWMSAYEAAWLMSVEDVSRLPVVESGRLVGVIARSDLVRYFARRDDEIAADVRGELDLLALADVEVEVEDGCVILSGRVDRESDLRCLEHAMSHVPGVVGVVTKVTLPSAMELSAPAAA